jgi:hypothetical protein
LEILGTKNRISITMPLLTIHQWWSLFSHSNNYNNSQCCNSSQSSNPNLSCCCPSNPLLCHHNFQLVSSSSQHQCNHSQLLQWPSLKLSSLRRRRITHQRCKSANCRPFQKKTRQLQPDVQRLRTQTLLRLHALQEAAHLKHMFSWDDSDIEILLEMMTSDLEKFLNNLI